MVIRRPVRWIPAVWIRNPRFLFCERHWRYIMQPGREIRSCLPLDHQTSVGNVLQAVNPHSLSTFSPDPMSCKPCQFLPRFVNLQPIAVQMMVEYCISIKDFKKRGSRRSVFDKNKTKRQGRGQNMTRIAFMICPRTLSCENTTL